MSDIQKIGQTLLVGELYSGLAARDSENTALRLAQSRNEYGNSSSDQKVQDLEEQNHYLRQQLEISQAVSTQARQALAARDALVLEWMHSNEAFKQLARNYGKKLGVSDEQRKDDFAHAVVDVAEEDPKYAKTELAESKRQQIKASPKP